MAGGCTQSSPPEVTGGVATQPEPSCWDTKLTDNELGLENMHIKCASLLLSITGRITNSVREKAASSIYGALWARGLEGQDAS